MLSNDRWPVRIERVGVMLDIRLYHIDVAYMGGACRCLVF